MTSEDMQRSPQEIESFKETIRYNEIPAAPISDACLGAISIAAFSAWVNSERHGFHAAISNLPADVSDRVVSLMRAVVRLCDAMEELRKPEPDERRVSRAIERASETAAEANANAGYTPPSACVNDIGSAVRLMLIVSETAEAFDELTKPTLDREAWEAELADIHICLGDLAIETNVDLGAAVAKKHAKNIARPVMHGGKRF